MDETDVDYANILDGEGPLTLLEEEICQILDIEHLIQGAGTEAEDFSEPRALADHARHLLLDAHLTAGDLVCATRHDSPTCGGRHWTPESLLSLNLNLFGYIAEATKLTMAAKASVRARPGAVKGAATRRADANRWREPAFQIAKEARLKDSEISQAAIATKVKRAIQHTPTEGVIVAQISKWEKEGRLPIPPSRRPGIGKKLP